jgi:hypothetical protein
MGLSDFNNTQWGVAAQGNNPPIVGLYRGGDFGHTGLLAQTPVTLSDGSNTISAVVTVVPAYDASATHGISGWNLPPGSPGKDTDTGVTYFTVQLSGVTTVPAWLDYAAPITLTTGGSQQPVAPSAPSNLAVADRTGGFRASWDAVHGATQYEYAYTEDGHSEVTGTTTSTTVDVDVAALTVFKVRVTTSAGTSDYTSDATWLPPYPWAGLWYVWNVSDDGTDVSVQLRRRTSYPQLPSGLDDGDTVTIGDGSDLVQATVDGTPRWNADRGHSDYDSAGFTGPHRIRFFVTTPSSGAPAWLDRLRRRADDGRELGTLSVALGTVSSLPDSATPGEQADPQPQTTLARMIVRHAGSEELTISSGFRYAGIQLSAPLVVSARLYELIAREGDLPAGTEASDLYAAAVRLRGIRCGVQSVEHNPRTGLWTLRVRELPEQEVDAS